MFSDSNSLQFDFLKVVSWKMFSFPRAALTNNDKLGGLKQQKFIISSLWSAGVKNNQGGAGNTPCKGHWEEPLLAPCTPGSPRHLLAVAASL